MEVVEVTGRRGWCDGERIRRSGGLCRDGGSGKVTETRRRDAMGHRVR